MKTTIYKIINAEHSGSHVVYESTDKNECNYRCEILNLLNKSHTHYYVKEETNYIIDEIKKEYAENPSIE